MRERGAVSRLAAFFALVMMGTVMSASTSASTDTRLATPEPVTQSPDPGTASRLARLQGSPVLVTDLITQTRLVRAEPSGGFTAELTTQPVRIKRGHQWVDVDTTLVRHTDGSIAPRASATDLVLSGGGLVPLLRYGHDGRQITLTWPDALPKPVLRGDTATYPEVYPGVDLVIRAAVTGYTQHVVVKTAQAAKHPALSAIQLGLHTQGVAASVTKSGALEMRAATGELVFAAPPSLMWDSAEQRREAPVGVVVRPGSLVLKPDRALLTDSAATLPIVIDPAPVHIDKSAWASVYSGAPNTPYWNDSADPGNTAQVGYCGWSGCGSLGNARVYFQYDTRWLAGKVYYGAWLNTTAVYGPGCTYHDHALYHVSGQIHSGTTYNNHPAEWEIDRKPVKSNQNCAGNVPVGFDTKGHVQFGGISTYMIRAVTEGDKYAWRKYDPAATRLLVSYNTKPNAPTALTTVPQRAACKWCGGRQWLGDDFVKLRARLSDPDGDQVKPIWTVSGLADQVGPVKNSGELAEVDVDLRSRPDGQVVTWSVRADDGRDDGPGGSGPAFAVDRTPVTEHPVVRSELYPADNRWHGGVGVAGRFTFEPAGVTDIDHYVYGWDSAATKAVDAESLGGNATVWIAPDGDGPRDLYVRSVDRAGRQSPTTVHHIYVRSGDGPLAQWSLEGNAKDTAFLGDRHGTIDGEATFTSGAVGTALALNPATQAHVTAPNTVRTDASFSVAAWVKIDAGGYARAAVSQDGTNFAGFDLWYRPDNGGRWVFGMAKSDASYQGTDMAVSAHPAQIGVWTHLAGVYEAQQGQLRLYVNGVRAGTAGRTAVPWHASGPLRIGQTMWNGSPAVDFFNGTIDEVGIWDRALSDAEVRAAVGRSNVQLGHWRLDDQTGGKAVNAVTGGAAGILTDGATFTESGAIGGGVVLNGTSAAISTAGPVMRTDQSYTVAAWVKADRLAASGAALTVISQDGARNSGFFLQQRGSNWMFGMLDADGSGSWAGYADTPAGSAQAGTWVHLAAVFDADAMEARIYLDGVAGRTGVVSTVWHASGAFAVGRGQFGGNPVDFFPGVVDEVRAYSRSLSTAEIQGIISQNNVTAGRWKLDGNAADSSGSGRDGSEINAPDYTGGQSSSPDPGDLALKLDGSSTFVSAPHAVNTAKSFSVAVWARLDRLGGHPAVVSQDGNRISAFQLQATPTGHWALTMFSADVDGGAAHYRLAGPSVQIGVWTHLAGVFDAGDRKLHLYVNGVLAGSRDAGPGWDVPTGGLQIGAARWNGNRVDYFPGAIDDVAVYSRMLFAEEILAMAGRDLSLVHHWALDEGSGGGSADAVGGRGMTLGAGTTRVAGKSGNALRFNGSTGTATTSGLDLRTDDSFTVSAWVFLETMDCEDPYVGCRRDAVSADATTGSKFRLGHVVDDGEHQSGSWIFELPEPDGTVTKAAVYAEPRDLKRWVHLVGVYDAPAKTIWIYVDGVREGDGTLNTPWKATGGVVLGRGKAGGTATAYWPGSVDDVRLYTGTFDKERVTKLFFSYPAEGGPAPVPTDVAGYWKLDDGSAATAADSSGRGQTATFAGGSGWIGGRKGGAAKLDGTTAYAQTSGAVLDTAQSFSVTAWVYLSDYSSANRTIVAQDGNRVSAFLLQYNASTRKWAGIIPSADADEPGGVVLTSTETAPLSDWTHLALTYDRGTQQLRLYVNGVLSAVRVGVQPWASSGPLTIGRAKWNGGNADYFKFCIDDVRAFGRALSAAEVRAVHDDTYAANLGFFRFDDGTVRDNSWRDNPTTASGGVSFEPGVSSQAVRFNGSNGFAATQYLGASTRDSFTVAAWAKLAAKDRVATVLGQDGSRMSSFFLQYRPGLDRWVFGAPTQDADSAGLVYANSLLPPVVDQWTHLAGVYDYAASELRLYVDGKLVGTRTGVALWVGNGGFTIGRAKVNGQPGDFFSGAVDEVATYAGSAKETDIAQWAGWPAPQAGGIGRYANQAGDRYTAATGGPPREGYRFESTLGVPVPASGPNTAMLVACQDGGDGFTSLDPACEGKTKVGDIGLVFTLPPTNIPTLAIYSCRTGTDRFESRQADCAGATIDGLLGYTQAYAPSFRYYGAQGEHWTDVNGGPVGYRNEGPQGFLALNHLTGTQQIFSCVDGYDQFVTTDPTCEGKRMVATLGEIWTEPPSGMDSRPIYACRIKGERFVDLSQTCAGYTVDGRIGYVLVAPPSVTPEFA